MPDIYPHRDHLIDLLVDDDINRFYDRDDQADYLAFLMRVGFAGYEHQTDQELIDECIEREFNFEEFQNA